MSEKLNQILERKEFEERENYEYYLQHQKINLIKNLLNEKNIKNIIDLKELKEALNKYGIAFNKEDLLKKELEKAKKYGNTAIDFEQFIDSITLKLSDMNSEKDLFKFYSLFLGDDNSDKIEQNNLRKLKSNLKDNEIKEMIEKADNDKDGKINFEEFYNIITKNI